MPGAFVRGILVKSMFREPLTVFRKGLCLEQPCFSHSLPKGYPADSGLPADLEGDSGPDPFSLPECHKVCTMEGWPPGYDEWRPALYDGLLGGLDPSSLQLSAACGLHRIRHQCGHPDERPAPFRSKGPCGFFAERCIRSFETFSRDLRAPCHSLFGLVYVFTFDFAILGKKNVPQAMKSSKACIRKHWKNFLFSYLSYLAKWAALLICGLLLLYVFPCAVMANINISLIGHRAGGNLANENTVRGLKEAVSHGAYGAEIDVQRTKDGYYIINHDNIMHGSGWVFGYIRARRKEYSHLSECCCVGVVHPAIR